MLSRTFPHWGCNNPMYVYQRQPQSCSPSKQSNTLNDWMTFFGLALAEMQSFGIRQVIPSLRKAKPLY